MKSPLFALLLSVLLSACAAPASAPTYSQAPVAVPKEGLAVLYIYREYAEPTVWNTSIYVDGEELVSLPQQSFSWVYLSPGKHTIASRWSLMASVPPLEFSLNAKSGTRYFFEIKGTVRAVAKPANYNGPPSAIHMRTTAQMNGAQEREAIKQLERCCRFLAPNFKSR